MNTNKIKFDTNALRERILDQYESIEQFAEVTGMTAKTLNSRLDNETEFVLNEIVSIREALTLNNDEVTRLFFTKVNAVMTCAEYLLFHEITNLCIGRPDRQRYALNYTGEIADLPAVLAQI